MKTRFGAVGFVVALAMVLAGYTAERTLDADLTQERVSHVVQDQAVGSEPSEGPCERPHLVVRDRG